MDQNTTNNESAPFVLPEVHPEELANGVNPQEVVANTHEEQSMAKAIEGGTMGASNSAAPAAQVQQDFVDPSMFVAPAPAPAQTQGTPKQIKVVTDDLHAADNDLIEKAWVVKAKAIVEQTKDDPYEQTNEIKKIKADYQRKRFNSNLKIDTE